MNRKIALLIFASCLILVASAAALSLTYAFSQVDVPNSTLTSASGINVWGTIVGRYVDSSGRGGLGFVFSRGQFTTLRAPGAGTTTAHGINDRGDVVGYSYIAGSPHGFLYRNGTFSTIDFPQDSISNFAHGINDAGDIVGTFRDTSLNYHGFLLKQGQYTKFDYPGAEGIGGDGRGIIASGPAINNVGDIVGTYFGTDHIGHAFLLRNGIFTNIDFPGSLSSSALGINAWGVTSGYYTDSSEVSHGFILRNGGYTTVDFPGASSIIAGINAVNAIVGDYFDCSGNRHGYQAVPRL